MVIHGITLPFYPMRPKTGRVVNAKSVHELWAEINSGEWFAQKKLNGDRAIVGVQDGQVVITNRYGDLYKHTVANMDSLKKLPAGTILDGEVWQKQFHPFEAIAIGPDLLLKATPKTRAEQAELLLASISQAWMFNPPTFQWLARLQSNLPNFEGVVMKRAKSGYDLMGSATQESGAWFKRKW